jgi:hypothetical protein
MLDDLLDATTLPVYAVLLLLVVLLIVVFIIQPAIARKRCQKYGHRWSADEDGGRTCRRCGHGFDLDRWKDGGYNPWR